MSAPFLTRRRLLDAAVRVQSSFRSFQDRKVADLAARFAAYQEVGWLVDTVRGGGREERLLPDLT
jgi:hypothetical protein